MTHPTFRHRLVGFVAMLAVLGIAAWESDETRPDHVGARIEDIGREVDGTRQRP